MVALTNLSVASKYIQRCARHKLAFAQVEQKDWGG